MGAAPPSALLGASELVDVAAVARQAVAGGADVLGVAGGDGAQALRTALLMTDD